MADNPELDPYFERLKKEQAAATEKLKDLRSDFSSMRSDFSGFRSAMTEMTQGIRQLNVPLLSIVSEVFKSAATYQQKTQLQQQSIDITKTQIAKIQTSIKQEEAKIEVEYEKLRSINAQIAILNDQDAQATERANAIIEEISLIEQRNKSLKSEISSIDKNIVEQEAAAREKLAAQRSEIERLQKIKRSRPAKTRSASTDAALSRKIALMEQEAAAQEAVVSGLSEQARLLEQLNSQQEDNKTRIARLHDEREEWQEQSNQVRDRIWDLETKAAEQLKVANATYDKGQEIIKAKQKEEQKLTEKLKKQEKELKAEKWRALGDSLGKVANALNDFVKIIRETQNALGISSANALDVVVGNYISSLKSFFTNATTVSTKEIMAARQSFQAEFGGVISKEAATELATQAKDLGVTTQELAGARRAFMTTTMGDLEQSKAQQDKLLTTFRQQGLTNKDAMDFVTKNSEIVARNGTRFSQSLFRAAADAKKIGVDLGKLDQIGDNIIGDFEGFLEKTAELGAMGFNLDVNTLGQIAESGDTGALMGELRSQLAAQGKDLTNLRRSEQLALSQAFGVSMGDLQRLAGPTAGSGEETEKQTDEKSLLTIIADKLGGILTAVSSLLAVASAISSVMSVRISLQLAQIVRNTAAGLFGGDVGDIDGRRGRRRGRTPRTRTPRGGPRMRGIPRGITSRIGGITRGVTSRLGSLAPMARGTSKFLGRAATPLAVTAGVYEGYTGLKEASALEQAGQITKKEANEKRGEAVGGATGGVGGTLVGAKAGAAIGTMIFPGVGTAIGGLLGSVIGYFAGEKLGKAAGGAVGKSITSDATTAGAETKDATTSAFVEAIPAAADQVTEKSPITEAQQNITSEDIQRTLGQATNAEKQQIEDDLLNMRPGGARTPVVTPPVPPVVDTTPSKPIAAAAPNVSVETQAALPPIKVDLAALEAKLDQVVRAINGMKVEMDGAAVGKMVAAAESRKFQTGIFRTEGV